MQLEHQITNLTNARSLYMDRQAEAASRQMQLQMMSTPLTMQQANAIGHPELIRANSPARTLACYFVAGSRLRGGTD